MKRLFSLSIYFCLLFSISCTSNNTTNKNYRTISILNEKWSNDESFDLSSLPKSTIGWYNQMHNGTDCSFYQDNTFEICIWWYGVSSGWFKSFIRGNYQYITDSKTIELFVDENSKHGITYNLSGKPYPTIYYMMEGLRIKNRLHSDYIQEDKIPILSNPKVKILDEKKDTIKVELSAFDEKGNFISFGKQRYIREKLDEDKRLLNN